MMRKKQDRRKHMMMAVSMFGLVAVIFGLTIWKSSMDFRSTTKRLRIVEDTAPVQEQDETISFSEEQKKMQDEVMAELTVAAKKAEEAAPVEGDLSERPAFVAEFEWDILKKLSENNPGKDLSSLANKLLFFKKFESWKTMADKGGDTAERRKLADQMIAMLPAVEKDLGPKLAQDMKSEIMNNL